MNSLFLGEVGIGNPSVSNVPTVAELEEAEQMRRQSLGRNQIMYEQLHPSVDQFSSPSIQGSSKTNFSTDSGSFEWLKELLVEHLFKALDKLEKYKDGNGTEGNLRFSNCSFVLFVLVIR